MKKRLVVSTLSLALVLSLATGALAMGGMSMPMPQTQSQAPQQLDPKAAEALIQKALDGLSFTGDQAMAAHDTLAAVGPAMDKLMTEIDAAMGAAKDLKNQEMMLLMQKAQVDLEAALNATQAEVLDALVFGEFPDQKAYPTDPAQVARLKAATDVRAGLDDHAIIDRVLERLAGMMTMPGMEHKH